MPWVQLTETHLLDKLTPAELDGYRNAAASPQDTDPVGNILLEAAGIVRGSVAQKNQLEAGDLMVPMSLLHVATDIATWSILRRGGGQVLDQSGARSKAYEMSMDSLRKVEAGERPVERPATADSQLWGGQVPSWHRYRSSQFNSTNERGLI